MTTRATRSKAASASATTAEPTAARATAAKKASASAAASKGKSKSSRRVAESESESESEGSSASESDDAFEEEVEVAVQPTKAKAARGRKAAVAPAAPPSDVPALHVSLGELFASSQHSYHVHAGVSTQATRLLRSDPDAFLTSFSAHVSMVCARGKKEATTARVVEWCGGFVAACFNSPDAAASAFAERFLERLLSWSGARDRATRWRSVQLLSELLRSLSEECDLPEWLFDAAVDALTERCEDKIEAVRVAAAAALHRLQSGEERDPVVVAYVRMMTLDTAPAVRRAAIEHVAAATSARAIAALLARVGDAEASVRAAALRAVAAKLHMKQLSIEERVRLLRLGLKDRDESVVKAARALADSWWSSKDRDVLRLLKSLAVDAFPDECSLVVAHFVRTHGTAITPHNPPYASGALTHEKALYWRVLAETLRSRASTDEASAAALDACLPDTVELCALLRAHVADEFVTSQLLGLLCVVDLADEAGRRELGGLVESLLRESSTTSQSLVAPLMRVQRLLHPDENELIRVTLELLSDIHSPLDDQQLDDADAEWSNQRDELERRYAQMQKQVEQLKVKKQACINVENFQGAEEIKGELTALLAELDVVERRLNAGGRRDDGTWARLLSIVCDLLEHVERFTLAHPGLAGLRESIIEPGIQHEHILIQSLGLKALSLYALLDRDTARASLPMFLYAANVAETLAQQATAMRAVTDILLLFEDILAPAPVAPAAAAGEDGAAESEPAAADSDADADSSKVTLSQVSDLFNRHLQSAFEGCDDQAQTEVVVMAVECFAKLLLFGRLPCAPVTLSALLYLFFHPRTDTRLAQVLAVFLPAFLLARRSHVAVFVSSVLPTLRILHSAVSAAAHDADDDEDDNVWRGFSVANAARAMLSFAAGVTPNVRVAGRSVQQALALEVLAQLVAFPSSTQAPTLVHLLTLLDISEPNAPAAPESTLDAAAQPPPPFRACVRAALAALSDTLRERTAQKDLSKLGDKWEKAWGGDSAEDAAEELDRADEWLTLRADELRAEQEEEARVLADGGAGSGADGEDQPAAARGKKVASAPARGKKALRPKTPAKSRRKAAQADSSSEASDSDDQQQQEEESSEEEEESNARVSAAAPKKSSAAAAPRATANASASSASASSRPSRSAKNAAQTKMAAERKKQAEVDKVLDAESDEEEDEE